MGNDECPFLGEHLVLFGGEPLHQLPSHGEEHRAEEHPAKDERGVVLLQTLTEHWHVAETHPPVYVQHSGYGIQWMSC